MTTVMSIIFRFLRYALLSSLINRSLLDLPISSQAIGQAMTFLADVDQAVDSCASILTITRRRGLIDARRSACVVLPLCVRTLLICRCSPDAIKGTKLQTIAKCDEVEFRCVAKRAVVAPPHRHRRHRSYPNRPEQLVLRGLSCRTVPGKTLAIVGASGSGKSTVRLAAWVRCRSDATLRAQVVSLVQRLYDVDNGTVVSRPADVCIFATC